MPYGTYSYGGDLAELGALLAHSRRPGESISSRSSHRSLLTCVPNPVALGELAPSAWALPA